MVAVTLDLIGSAEVRSITMEAIAERAGISKVTLYRRWPSKAALLADVLLAQLSSSARLDMAKPPISAISEHVHTLCQALEGQMGQLFRIVAAECMVEPTGLATFRDQYMGLGRRTAMQIIRRGIRDGSFSTKSQAIDCHDAIYGTIFFRFLFGFGAMDRLAIDQVLAAALQAGRAG